MTPESLETHLTHVGLDHRAFRRRAAADRNRPGPQGCPRLILADEPTAALDAQTESVILKRLNKAHPLATLILVSHRPHAVRDMDMILVLAGEIEEAGTHKRLIQQSRLYAQLWRQQEQE